MIWVGHTLSVFLVLIFSVGEELPSGSHSPGMVWCHRNATHDQKRVPLLEWGKLRCAHEGGWPAIELIFEKGMLLSMKGDAINIKIGTRDGGKNCSM